MAPPSLPCPSCGLFVEPARRCPECNAPLDQRGDVAPASPLVFVRASWNLRCPACHDDTPLSRIAAPLGSCASCRTELLMPHDGLTQVIGMAHDVASLAGTGVDGREMKRAFGLECDARRGHPTCRTCSKLLSIELEPDGAVMQCPGCGMRSSWHLPADLRGIHDGLRVVFGAGMEELPEQAAEAVVELSADRVATAVRCPSCNAPLSMPDRGSTLVTCKYCATLCHLSMPAAPQLTELAAPVLWLGFEGPSPAQQKEQRRHAAKESEARARARRKRKEQGPDSSRAEPDNRGAWRGKRILAAIALLVLGGLIVAALALR